MKLAFTGDLSLHNIDKYTSNPFRCIEKELSSLNPVINLEAPFLPEISDIPPIKQKICTSQKKKPLLHIRKINPFLVNLSNNHINDYGNLGVEYTKQVLNSSNLRHFGAGLKGQDHNIFVLEKEKIIFLSYTSRTSDLSGGKLFNEKNLLGPKELDISLIEKQIKDYPNYKKIILVHWGIEQKHYPMPEIRAIARKIAEIGVDIIIGNHPHTVQGYEKYKGCWIFYSLGNFIFPDLHFKLKNKDYFAFQFDENRISFLPVFNIEEKISLSQVLTIKLNKKFEASFIDYNTARYNKGLMKSEKEYQKFYRWHLKAKRLNNLIKMPLRLVEKKKKSSVLYQNVRN
jgi:poly-gamma-glutamate synthesis protein (capsule biosynthesis protein)